MTFTTEEIETMRQEAIKHRDEVLCGFSHIAEKPFNCLSCKCYDPEKHICIPNDPDAEKEIHLTAEEAEEYTMLACDFYLKK